jgi:hypothetical protein
MGSDIAQFNLRDKKRYFLHQTQDHTIDSL